MMLDFCLVTADAVNNLWMIAWYMILSVSAVFGYSSAPMKHRWQI